MEWNLATKADSGVKIPDEWVFLPYYEAYNLLFRIENALRVFVYVILKEEFKSKWHEVQVIGDEADGTIDAIAKRRMEQSSSYGYLGHRILCPIMHLTSGELTRLVTSDAYWRLFRPNFLGKLDVIKTKLEEIGTIRNSLAHFRPIRQDDVEVLKQNSKQVLAGVEDFLKQILDQRDVVPTNTTDEWYTRLSALGSEHCSCSLYQSRDQQWIDARLSYSCPEQRWNTRHDDFLAVHLLTLKSSAVPVLSVGLRDNMIYLMESVDRPHTDKSGGIKCAKRLSLVFSRKTLSAKLGTLEDSFKKLLECIEEETGLMLKDNLARGQVVTPAQVAASKPEDTGGASWDWTYDELSTPVQECDSPEYWGSTLGTRLGHFISATPEYPWMPVKVSGDVIPF